MPVPTGQASFADIQSNFGGSNPIAISEYYTGGGITKSNIGGFAPNGIPSSGQISVDDFRGATNAGETHSGTITVGTGFFITSTYYGFSIYVPSSMAGRQMTQGTSGPPWRIDNAAFRTYTPKGGSATNDYYFSGTTFPSTPQPWNNSDTGAFKTLTDGSMTISRANMSYTLTGPSNAASIFSYTAPSNTPGFSMNSATSGTRSFTLDCI